MAYHIKGNRILSEEENAQEGCMEGLGALILVILGVLFILSPGILITSLLNLFIDFTTGQLWGTAIVGCIIVIIGLFALKGEDGLGKHYLITAVVCSLFMFVSYLMVSENNCFYNTVTKMFSSDSSSTENATESFVPSNSDEVFVFYKRVIRKVEDTESTEYAAKESKWSLDA